MNLASATVTKWVEEGLEDPEAFWARAAQELPWFRTWDRVYEADPPTFRWFIGAQTNIAHNALDHHVADGRGDRNALIYFNERGDEVTYTYAELLAEVPAALEWDSEKLKVAGAGPFDPGSHLPMLIYPNPKDPEHYVVINSGHSFGAREFKGTNAYLFPRRGVWNA